MRLNNTWTNDEDYCSFQFNVSLILSERDYLDELLEFNKSLHALTWKYRLLMTLSPDYCEKRGVDYFSDYHDYLLRNKEVIGVLPRIGYQFYKKSIDPVSLMFFCREDGLMISSYVHYLQNGLYGNPVYAQNENGMEPATLKKFMYDSSPIRFDNLPRVKMDNLKHEVTISFSIESHLTIWMDYISSFKYLDMNGRLQVLEESDNRKIAYRNTPRLNSFLRDIRSLVDKTGGTCELHDFKSLNGISKQYIYSNRTDHRQGLTLDGKIIYEEDIEEGKVELPEC